MRFEAERGEFDTAIFSAFLIVGIIGNGTLGLAENAVGRTTGAHDGDIVGDCSRVDEVVSDDVARSPIVACN